MAVSGRYVPPAWDDKTHSFEELNMTVNVVSSGEVLLHAKQVASMLQIQLCTVYELARTGKLPSIRVGNRVVRFRRSSIERWLVERESRGLIQDNTSKNPAAKGGHQSC